MINDEHKNKFISNFYTSSNKNIVVAFESNTDPRKCPGQQLSDLAKLRNFYLPNSRILLLFFLSLLHDSMLKNKKVFTLKDSKFLISK